MGKARFFMYRHWLNCGESRRPVAVYWYACWDINELLFQTITVKVLRIQAMKNE
jgi:hypothetical protein